MFPGPFCGPASNIVVATVASNPLMCNWSLDSARVWWRTRFSGPTAEWMQKSDRELGMLSSVWRSATDLRASCRCFEHDRWKGRGTSFQFQATSTWSQDDKRVLLSFEVQEAGSCDRGTPRKVKANAQADKPATVAGRGLVQQAVAHLAEDKKV